ncbi:hypothetical protein CTI12_AA279710 [Artemisia annua]|uniref:Retrotransposon Copia-like N-terminal domain-containing protein n=1 Tax=Artemisia annua TaxID=35608 RepID=A0A2U1NB76_ARTAN|nr:hypothetical protein CTI12_AA279710 [Artemisia annua]
MAIGNNDSTGGSNDLHGVNGGNPNHQLPEMNVNDPLWIRCDYMVTCWILNSMIAELSDSFLYSQSASDLWKDLEERYGTSNGPLIYQVEREFFN